MAREGGCLCGAIRYHITGEPDSVLHCHCTMCQRSGGAAFLTWACFPAGAFAWMRGEPRTYRSSPGVSRTFCSACGSPLTFARDGGRTIDVTLTTLDDPDALSPGKNIWTDTRRAWVHGFDERLPDRRDEP